MSDELVKEAIEMMLDNSRGPMVVLDTSGIHEIGMIFGCLRRLMRWGFSSVLVEVGNLPHLHDWILDSDHLLSSVPRLRRYQAKIGQ